MNNSMPGSHGLFTCLIFPKCTMYIQQNVSILVWPSFPFPQCHAKWKANKDEQLCMTMKLLELTGPSQRCHMKRPVWMQLALWPYACWDHCCRRLSYRSLMVKSVHGRASLSSTYRRRTIRPARSKWNWVTRRCWATEMANANSSRHVQSVTGCNALNGPDLGWQETLNQACQVRQNEVVMFHQQSVATFYCSWQILSLWITVAARNTSLNRASCYSFLNNITVQIWSIQSYMARSLALGITDHCSDKPFWDAAFPLRTDNRCNHKQTNQKLCVHSGEKYCHQNNCGAA